MKETPETISYNLRTHTPNKEIQTCEFDTIKELK